MRMPTPPQMLVDPIAMAIPPLMGSWITLRPSGDQVKTQTGLHLVVPKAKRLAHHLATGVESALLLPSVPCAQKSPIWPLPSRCSGMSTRPASDCAIGRSCFSTM